VITWSDNGAGGSFSPNQCLLSGSHCALEYNPPSNPSGSITITAAYGGDSSHSSSSGTVSLSGPLQSVTTQPSPTPQSSESTPQSTESTPTSTTPIPSAIQSTNLTKPMQSVTLPKQSTPASTQNIQPVPAPQSSSPAGQPTTSKSIQAAPTTQSTSTQNKQQANTGTVIREIEQLPQKIISEAMNIIESLVHQL
jgi:hypothetical protein